MRCGLAGEVKVQLLYDRILRFLGNSAVLFLVGDAFEDCLRVIMRIIDNFPPLARCLNNRIPTHARLIRIGDNFNLYLGVIWLDDILLWGCLSTIPQERRGVD